MFPLGIVQPEDKLVENGNRMQSENFVDSFFRVLLGMLAYMLLGIFTVTQQDMDVFKGSLIFCLLFLLIPVMRFNYDLERKMNQYINEKFGQPGLSKNLFNSVLQVFNSFEGILVEIKHRYNAHRYYGDLSAAYQCEEDYFQNFLVNQLFNGYGFIPVIGPVIGVFTSFMNDPSLSESGETSFEIGYFLNWLHFISILATVLLHIYVQNNAYVVTLVIYFLCAALDAFDFTSELIPAAKRLSLAQIFPCIKKWLESKKEQVGDDDDVKDIVQMQREGYEYEASASSRRSSAGADDFDLENITKVEGDIQIVSQDTMNRDDIPQVTSQNSKERNLVVSAQVTAKLDTSDQEDEDEWL
ncbi:Conserved_hypothetical protein [Hexamita inflata]|nr:Conserved hypothetical protein [Hexamita inflata]